MQNNVSVVGTADDVLPILFRPPCAGTETPGDYLARVFEAHGYPWSSQYYKRLGVSRKELLSKENGADRTVAVALDIDQSDLSCVSPDRITSKKTHICGEELHSEHWASERRRWCPGCWQDDMAALPPSGRPPLWNVHSRFWWYVAPISCCPVHSCKLLNACPHCGAYQFTYVGNLLQCKCGYFLPDARKEMVPKEDTAFDAYVLGRLGVLPPRIVPFLDQGTLEEAIEIVMHLGHAAIGDPTIGLKSFRGDRQVELMRTGFAIADGWPMSFHALLEERVEPGAGWTNDKRFGPLFRWIKALKPGKSYDELKSCMLQYVATTTVTTKSSTARRFQNGRQATITSLARELGISIAKCRLYLAAVGHAVERTGSGRSSLVDEVARRQVVELFEDRLNQSQLEDKLGVGKKIVRELVARELLVEDPVHKQVSKSARMYKSLDVDRLLERLAMGLQEMPEFDATTSGLKSIPQAAQLCRGVNTAKACILILDGQLRCRGWLRREKGLSGLLTTPADIKVANSR